MQPSLMARRRSGESGFTLVEMAIALSILGIMVAAILQLHARAKEQNQIDLTYRNMNKVLSALSSYVESTGRLPCPADPGRGDELFGWEWGVTQASIASGRPVPDQNPGDPLDNPTCESWGAPGATGGVPRNVGIVPFLTLDLDPADVRDGWGRYMTYAVSPIYAQNNDNVRGDVARLTGTGSLNPAAADQGSVHIRCLDGGWYDNKDVVNGVKAKFCCNRDGNAASPDFPTDSDIQILDLAGDPVWPDTAGGEPYMDLRDRTNNHFDLVSPGLPGGYSAQYEINYDNIVAPALVLVSHGESGNGAFMGNDTRNRYSTGVAGTAEQDNGAETNAASWDRTFRVGSRSSGAGASFFDDIVVWRTQAGIMAENGTSSCRYP
ncbi:MAG: type II secretion system protein [Micavibrio aeruginosavorus]|nr:type II secretion system protein [Micavibrio aeruginosavorus]